MKQTTSTAQSLLKTYHQGHFFAEYDANLASPFSLEFFNSDYWQRRDAVEGTAQGRGTTWFVKHDEQQWVLRHYYRGGLVGKFIHDCYWFTSYPQTRAAREFHLLHKLAELKLPAPTPVAYHIVKRGFCYRADLITQRIANAKDLVAILSQSDVSKALWQKIGQTIKQFHQHGIYHHDLNAHNILIDEQEKVWLIDFDQGEQRQQKAHWPEQNMARLLRSFKKEKAKHKGLAWHEQDWQCLLQGYA